MQSFTHIALDEEATAVLGRHLANALPPTAVVALSGPLGAGKTRLVQAVAEAAGVDRRMVTSPTFMLVQEYRGKRLIYHLDAYRLKDDDEFLALGPEEIFSAEAWTFIEWAERVERCLPNEYLSIDILVPAASERHFKISAVGSGYEDVVAKIAASTAGLVAPTE